MYYVPLLSSKRSAVRVMCVQSKQTVLDDQRFKQRDLFKHNLLQDLHVLTLSPISVI